ncbi:hypothetical protein L226DRAFT_103583 [Lentinus tigrinus ALCF2SS1-7]|uniref:uncharacterized protein n=1 Tax=Lentinus tigrinus ALCF2SS1-7 TaxID=1328758 RepID=UPI00116612E4|nr:hypothetical protein L226DRAFT_103583 [Lentinus tigrinus ALCF2SS1-7]
MRTCISIHHTDHNMFKWIPAGNGSASWTSVASLPPGSSTLNDHSGRPAFQRPQATSTQHQAPSPTPPIPVRSTPERRGYGQAPDIRKRRWRLSIPACALPPAVKDVSGEGV